MSVCYACKQPLKSGKPHTVAGCAEALHRALDAANLEIARMRAIIEQAAETIRLVRQEAPGRNCRNCGLSEPSCRAWKANRAMGPCCKKCRHSSD